MTARTKLATFMAASMLLATMLFARPFARPTAHAAACTTTVNAPANLQNALNAAGTGATVCLSGTFSTSSTIRPLAQQTIVGGALRYSGATNVCLSCDLTDGFELHAPGITLQGVEVYGFEGRGVDCGPGSTITGSYLHDNKQNGIACWADLEDYRLTITGNRIVHNGSSVLVGQSSGGVKLLSLSNPTHALGSGATVEGNTVSGNVGHGIWLDHTSSASIVRNNVSFGNSQSGIRCEKCAGPFLFDTNTARDNGDAGVTIHNSALVTVTNTTSYGNGGRSPVGVRVSFNEKAQKTYPQATPTTLGYHARTISVDTSGVSDGVRGCTYANVSCG
jgi:parallel beta-helix repeat protein